MYEENNVTYRVGINWKDIIIKVILLILFILLLLWIFPRPKLDVFYDSVYTNNIKTMKEAARNYYTIDRLPKQVGEQSSMTLKEMVDNHMIIRFTDKDGNTCDETNSKVVVTKNSDNEYVLKVQLNCGSQQDFILETIGCTTVCSNGTCTTVINNGNNSSAVAANNGTNNNNNNGSGNQVGGPLDNNNNNGSNNNSGTGNNSATERDDTDYSGYSVKDDTYTTKITYYQHKKAIVTTKTVYTCPAGYTRNGTKCLKTETGATIDATPHYTEDRVITTDAKVGHGEKTVYADPIKTQTGTDYSCPTGYTLNGKYCIKYTDATEKPGETTYTCPTGYTKNGTKCVKTYDATYTPGATSYTCDNGGTLSGKTCTITINATEVVSYTCPSGYEKNGTSCYKVYNATENVSYSCPSGYDRSGTKCTKTDTIDATPSVQYGSWVNGGTRYYTYSSAGYVGDTSKLVYQGSISGAACGAPCGNKGVWYKYIYYTRTKTTVYSCPSGYSQSGSKCSKSTTIDATRSVNYTCPNGGSLKDGKCTITTTATKTVDYTCPSGYTKKDKQCVKTYDATAHVGTGSYSCPNGGTLSGKTCTITTDATAHVGETTYTCPSGYTLNKETKKCELKKDATGTPVYSYTCPTGYTASGSGAETKCSKVEIIDGYYCEDKEATLTADHKCVKTVKGEIDYYTCPEGYKLEGTKCTKNNVITIDATASTETSTTYQYKWSEKSYLEGWTFTGQTKVVTKTYKAGQK